MMSAVAATAAVRLDPIIRQPGGRTDSDGGSGRGDTQVGASRGDDLVRVLTPAAMRVAILTAARPMLRVMASDPGLTPSPMAMPATARTTVIPPATVIPRPARVPMSRELNGAGKNNWYAMENEWARLLDGERPPKIEVSIDIDYSGKSLRPDTFQRQGIR